MGPQIDTVRADQAIAALAARQHGVVSRGQLLEAGLTGNMLKGRVARGRLLRLHRGVYAVGHRQLRREGHWLAAVLAVGPGAVLSHRAAAALHGIRPSGTRIDVTTTGRAADQRGIRVHHARTLDPTDITTVDGIPVTSVARTLVDLAHTVPRDHLTTALREAERLHLFDLRAIQAARARTRHREGPGDRALKDALAELAALATTHTRSPLEDAFLDLLRRAGLPQPRTNATVEGHEVDAYWPQHRLVAELDGWAYHRTRHAFESDRARDAELQAAGHRVVRFTHHQVTHRSAHVVEALRRLGLR
jgi:very-short-patch-repair endonuclease